MSGFIDLQVNGYRGIDFNQDQLTEEDVVEACRSLRADGVDQFLPTIITDDLRLMCRRIRRIADVATSNVEVAGMVAGIHVEGPFINPAPGFVGAHPTEHTRPPDVDGIQRLIEAGQGLVRMLTLAPELAGSEIAIRRLVEEGVVVAAGHSDASMEDLQRAIDAGLSMFTHLGNGCPGEMHRHDNIVQRVLAFGNRLTISFIADGHHVPFFALGNYLRMLPSDRIVIVTDAISAAGLGPGQHRLADQTVEVDEDLAAWASGREHFAGCATTMPRMVELLRARLGATDDDIRRWMVENPRRLLSGT
ncbi:MAG: N-acetylglucosamine-6-phosphate deacetylase [Planctomycetota bacterium]